MFSFCKFDLYTPTRKKLHIKRLRGSQFLNHRICHWNFGVDRYKRTTSIHFFPGRPITFFIRLEFRTFIAPRGNLSDFSERGPFFGAQDLYRWWLNHPFETYYIVKLDHFPINRSEQDKYLNPPPNFIGGYTLEGSSQDL